MRGGAEILLYHSVQEDDRFPSPSGVNLPPETFDRQLAFIRAGYRVVSLREAVSGPPRAGRPAVAVTFDDGYGDTGEKAWPLLKKHSVPATFFLTVSQVGRPWPFPRGPYPGLDWDRIREMAEDPEAEFGSHGLGHRDLTRLPDREAAREIGESKSLLEERLSRAVDFFSYPHGSYDGRLRGLVREAGYRAAFSVIPRREDNFSRRRILISRKDNLFRFRLKLSPLYWPLRKVL